MTICWMKKLLLGTAIAASSSANATFSIVACETHTGVCGVAIVTNNLAIGHGAPFAVAGVGAGVSQFETNPCHGPAIIASLAQGDDANGALSAAMKADAQCADGHGLQHRQIAVVSARGAAVAHTGQEAGGYAGHRSDGAVAVQGNGLASKEVLEAMWRRFHAINGPLGERLLQAVEAGQAAGGQTIGLMSAALLVATPDGWPVDTDLRVDFAPSNALAELRTAYNANVARQLLFRSERLASDGDTQLAQRLLARALALAPNWDRIWLRAARIASKEGSDAQAHERYCRFRRLNAAWAATLTGEFNFSEC